MKLENDVNTKAYLQRLNQQQRDLIVAKKSEIDGVNKIFTAKKEQARADGEIDLIDVHEQNDLKITESLNQKEERLGKIQKEFVDQRDKLEVERQNLVNTHKERISNLNLFYDDKYKEQFADAKLRSEDVNLETSTQINKLVDESNRTIRDQALKADRQVTNVVREHEKAIRGQETEFTRQRKTADSQYRTDLHQQKLEHEHKLNQQNMNNLIERNQRLQTHKKQIVDKDKHHEDLLKQKDAQFKQKYDALEKNHKMIFERMQRRFQQEIDAKVAAHSQTKAIHELKEQDDFYQIEKLSPKVKETLDSYVISIPVPEHEMEDARLTGHERTLSLSLTRRFADQTVDADGTINSNKRSEVFNKRFDVGQIVDPKNITQSYEEGVLSFKIAKL